MMSGRRDIGTATSVDQTSSPSRRSASILHRDSLRADQSVSKWCRTKSAYVAYAFRTSGTRTLLLGTDSKLKVTTFVCPGYVLDQLYVFLYLLCSQLHSGNCTTRRAEHTPALVPENLFAALSSRFHMISVPKTYLKNIVGSSFHFLFVEPALLITPICTSSMISIAATGTPARSTFEAAAAASRIVGKVTTATLVSCGTTASLRVISVTMPSVPSEPMKRFVRL
jgi:hypothetical protein